MLVTWVHDVYFIIALIITGISAGYLAGLFGVGGGAILVPVLASIFPYFGFDYSMDMHCAVGTSLALIVPGAISATMRHARQGTLVTTIWKLWLGAITAGIIIGTIISNQTHGSLLRAIFAIYMFTVAIALYRKKNSSLENKKKFPKTRTQVLVGTCVGCLSSMLGLGGGSFTVPFYTQYNFPIKKAIALGNVTGIAIGTLGAIGAMYNGWGNAGRPGLSIGYVNIPAFLLITPLMMLCAPQGAKISNNLSSKTLKLLCASFYFMMGTYMVMKLLLQYFL